MYGYIEIYKPELKVKDNDIYRSYYCGFCDTLKNTYGRAAQLTVGYDMVFLIILLTSLYDEKTNLSKKRCIVSPKKHFFRTNKFSEYAADMQILYVYLKCRDDWNDEHKLLSLVEKNLLENKFKSVKKKYSEKAEYIISEILKLENLEINKITDIDALSDFSGNIISELFSYNNDMWQESLRKIGFYIGKYIYILDAFEDVDKDIKNNNFNPLKEDYINLSQDEFNNKYYNILTNNISECSKEFEYLPIIDNYDILKNILYLGVWNRFSMVVNKRKKGEKIRCQTLIKY